MRLMRARSLVAASHTSRGRAAVPTDRYVRIEVDDLIRVGQVFRLRDHHGVSAAC